MASRWTEEQIVEALAIAAATSLNEAARRTGIPKTTLIRWSRKVGGPVQKSGPRTGPDRVGEKLAAMAEEVRQRAVKAAVEKVTEAISDRLSRLADQLYCLAEKAVGKVDIAISDQEELPPGKELLPRDRDGAAWLRSLVGVMAQSVDKAQLLSGKPTVRPEVVERREYEITQRIITERPELLDAIFAEDKRPGLEDWSGQGPRSGLGELR